MIVACSACRTRFRVADEKVGPMGARIRCSRCGQTFLVGPPPPPEPAQVAHEPTGTGGWPTGALEVAAASSDSSVGLALEADPFAAYATQSAPEPPPPEPPPVEEPFPESLPGSEATAEGGLALEERTPGVTPIRDGAARWSEPEASQAIEVGPDGFQEVDLASGAERPDPGFEALDDEATREVPFPSSNPPGPVPQDEEAPAAAPATASAPEFPARGAPVEAATAATRSQPARARALAMNVLSLAALLLVTLGIVLWWRGEGIGALLRWPRAGHADLDVGDLSSGVYEGSHGHPVIFVRGVVRATHEPVEGPVTIRVILERRGTLLGAATATAGAVPSAEELSAVTSQEGLQALRRQVDSRAAPRIAPGGDFPFLAVLPLPDGDVGTIQFRVETLSPPGR